MKRHFLDKPILRDLFWFIVLPYNLHQHMSQGTANSGKDSEHE